MLLLTFCYNDEKVILFVDTQFLFTYFIPILITLSIFSSSRLSTPFADEKKLGNNISYFTFCVFLYAQEKVIFHKQRSGLSYELLFRHLF